MLALAFAVAPLHAQREYTPGGAILQRIPVSPTRYTLLWGNVRFTRSLPDTFSVFSDDNPRFVWENASYLCLEAQCGPSCWYAILLPLDEEAEELFFPRPLAYDTLFNYIAYTGAGDTLVTIEHLTTGAVRHLVTWDRCGDEQNEACIRDVTFDMERNRAVVVWDACGSPAHPEAYATERTARIPLPP